MLIPHFEEDRSISNGSLRINVEDAILAMFIYIIILVFSGVLFRKSGNSLLKMFMFNSLIAIVMFIITTILLGILIGYIYVKTKSMYLCMYFHILFNTIDVIFIYLPEIQNLLLSIPFTILGVLFIIYGLKKINGFKIDIC